MVILLHDVSYHFLIMSLVNIIEEKYCIPDEHLDLLMSILNSLFLSTLL